MAFRDIRLRRQDPNPLIAQIISGGGLQEGGAPVHPAHLVAAAMNAAQPTGSLATLGRGMSTGGPGGQAPQDFTRRVVRRGNRLLEEHDYGPGTEARFFERKNPGVLAEAVRQSRLQGPRPNTLQTGAMLSGLQGQAQGDLSARDEELLKMLLGNPTLRR